MKVFDQFFSRLLETEAATTNENVETEAFIESIWNEYGKSMIDHTISSLDTNFFTHDSDIDHVECLL